MFGPNRGVSQMIGTASCVCIGCSQYEFLLENSGKNTEASAMKFILVVPQLNGLNA